MSGWLVDTLIASSALMALVLLIREPVRQQFGSGVAYALWLIPAARMVMPTLTSTIEREIQIIPAALPMASEPITATPALLPITTAGFEASPAARPDMIETLGGWPVILMMAWMAGAMALFAHRMLQYRLQRSDILHDAEPVSRLRSIRIVRSHAASGPIAFGIFDRVIAVPTDFMTDYSPRERRLALAHELAHHKSGDLIANFFAFVLLSLQWFNPLAWASYAAFRFDQEAACDARVLDVAGHRHPEDRASYGRAIAKAASGRPLLFASALGKESTLKRRLKSMMNTHPKHRRLIGNVLVVAAVGIALPLTASKAVNYVDVPAEPAASAAPVAGQAPAAPAAPTLPGLVLQAPTAAVAPHAPAVPHVTAAFQPSGIYVDGKQKSWSQMTAEEKREFNEGMQELREAIAEMENEKSEVRRELREAMADVQIDRAEMESDLADARRDIEEAMQDIDEEAAELRSYGIDPEAFKATIRASLASVEAIDVEKITREALASVDVAAVEASMAQAQESMRQALSEMEEHKRK
ncbi:M56 family metallopeptidase [Sphingomicrobium flavum]|uniref:M56 family metallopeptidase n=1 Tax=Sphingomicrobium flavum TaxID=1229164 RepID=UPI0021AD5A90|nr:M56 family metallopeptidase [Sphingomicrobium flavum]